MRFAALLAGGAVCLGAASAPAQYNPGMGVPLGGFTTGLYSNNPYAGGLNSYNFGYNYSFGFNYVNPISGGRTVFQIDRSYYSPSPYGMGSIQNPLMSRLGYLSLQPRGGASYVNPYLAGRAGYAAPGVNSISLEQARLARLGAAAKPNGPAPAVAPKPAARPAKLEAPLEVPQADPDAIRSGVAINALIPPINKRLDAGNKVDSPLIPAELLRNLRYTPGPAADLLAALRDGSPKPPAALDSLPDVKANLVKATTPVVKSVLAGKRPDDDESIKLAEQVKAARPKVEVAVKDKSKDERGDALAYLAGLDALAQVHANSNLLGVYNPTFATVGVSAIEYARHLEKRKLKLAAAPAGSANAYDALYRALAVTKAGLDREAR